MHSLSLTLKRSTFNLFDTWKAIQLALLNQLSELQSNQAKQQLRILLELSGTLYGVVRGWVSHEALRKVEEQRKLLVKKDPSSFLTCTGALLLDHFHSHWHLKRDGAPQLLREPRQRIEPIQALSSLPGSSTKREPSQFEVAEAQVTRPRRAPSRCTKCNAIGHTRTSKACPLRYSDIL